MDDTPDTHDPVAPDQESDSLEEGEALDLAGGTRGRRQLWLYFASLPFWFVTLWFLPDLLPRTGFVAVAAVGLLASAVAIWRLGEGIEERLRMTIVTLSIPYWLVVFWYSYTQLMDPGQYTTAFLGGILLLYVLSELDEPLIRRDWPEVGLLLGSAAISVGTSGYVFVNYDRIAVDTLGRATEPELAMAMVFTLAMIYLTWRAFGMTFLVVVLAGIGYGFAGPWMPGPLSHGGLSGSRILRIMVMSGDGFYGFLTKLVARWIALFLLYAGLLKAYGAFGLILRLAVRSAKYVDSGIAQTAVIASAVIGSVNGSQTANAGMTGSFTIPLMKKNGIKPETAGGIEAVASTSGQVLPPVMGAGAFIMAQFIPGITYVDVIVAGLIPAAILVVSIVVAVHYVAVPQIDDPEMSGVFETKLTTQEMLFQSVKYGVPMAVLIYALGIRQVTVMTAALWTAVSMIGFGIAMPLLQSALDREPVADTAVETGKQTIDGFREGTLVLAPVVIILASINGVVDILMATGVPTAISLTLMDLSGGVLIIAAVLAMIICILLGLGMPTTAAYTIVGLLVAPTLINQFFLPELASHMFVFYGAILAGLTPPIATCVAVTCGISGGGFWGSCREAIRISLPLFVLPFAFVYHPELVSGEFDYASLSAGGLAMVGALAMIHGSNSLFGFGRPVTYSLRAGFFVVGVLAMVHPEQLVQVGAVGAFVLLYLLQTVAGGSDPVGTVRSAVGLGRR